jgi:transposase
VWESNIDAALNHAVERPIVPVKATEQQAALMLVSVRDRLIRNRTQLANTIRGYAAEFGLTAAKGMAHLVPLLDRIEADDGTHDLGVCAAGPIGSRPRITAAIAGFLRSDGDPIRR